MLFNQKMTDSFVVDAMASIADMAHIKDATTKQYIHCNASILKGFGLKKVEEITGLTIQDLDGVMRPYWGDQYASRIDHMDHLVCTKLETITHKEVVVVRDGFIRLQTLIKMPLIGHNGKASSIFTFTQNLMDTVDLDSLYKLYKNHYLDKENAANYFLKYVTSIAKPLQSYLN